MQPVTSTTSPAPPAAIGTRPVQPAPERPYEPPAKTAPAFELDLASATHRVESFVRTMSSDLQFSIDETTGSKVVRVIDRATKEVIRQIPSDEMLAIAQALDRLQGLLIRQKA